MNQDRRLQELQALFADIDAAGQHFINARRELILGVREIVFAIERAAQPGTILSAYAGPTRPFLTMGRMALDRWLDAMADPDSPPLPAEFLAALQAVRQLLTEQLLRLDPSDGATERRGLLLALSLLDQEIERQMPVASATEANHQQQVNAVQWIEVKE